MHLFQFVQVNAIVFCTGENDGDTAGLNSFGRLLFR